MTKVQQIGELLAPFMLRRLKSDVELSIPPKTEIKIYVPLTELQIDCYKSIISHNVEFLEKFGSSTSSTHDLRRLMSILMQLRKVTASRDLVTNRLAFIHFSLMFKRKRVTRNII